MDQIARQAVRPTGQTSIFALNEPAEAQPLEQP